MTVRRLLPCLFLALLALPVVAGDRYVAIEKRLRPEALASIGLTAEQLSRLNALLSDADERDAALKPAVAGPGAGTNAGPPASPMHYVGLDNAPITANVRGSVAGWSPGTVFELDNGQQWKVLKGHVTLRYALDAPSVRLVPGIAGRWFLELDEDHPKARVYRID